MADPSMIYLDHAATTPVAPEVRDAMLPHLTEEFGNPSSIHSVGRRAREAVDQARDRLAGILSCRHGDLVLTSGGTEANNLALRGAVGRSGPANRHLVVSAVEHDSVMATAAALAEAGRAEVTTVPCDSTGLVDPERVAAAVRPDTVLVSVMLVNNEVGTIQDVAAMVARVRLRNPSTLFHTDAVQALGRLPLDVAELDVDLLSLSAHKVHGPKGTGALYIRRGRTLAAQLTGGGQERNRRSGTENVAGIVGFAIAAELAEARRPAEAVRLAGLAERLMDTVTTSLPGTVRTGAPDGRRAPGFATFAFAGVRTDLLLTALDGGGVCASGGSACSSGAPMPSHVLAAMAVPAALAGGALRCTPGRSTTMADIDRAAAAIEEAVRRVRRPGPETGVPSSPAASRRAAGL